MSDVRRWRCLSCREVYLDSEVLIGQHPFAAGSISGCPRFRAAFDADTELLCDEPGCNEEVAAGWPSPVGYRQTCGKHYAGE